MKLRTTSGDYQILMEAKFRAPFSRPSSDVFLSKDGNSEKADIVAVTSQIICEKDGHIYQGYHMYALADISLEIVEEKAA